MSATSVAPGVNIGETIVCRITKAPVRRDEIQTLERLMRRDKANSKALRRSQIMRDRRKVIRTRAGRPWKVGERCGKIVRVEEGSQWTMTLIPQLADDLKAVAKYLEISKA
ncbi:MAG TPA: hypothetical protein ENJ06_02785 [Phycisphaeraceae bacterium]|nr:hypothetical protein [Phycisphaeraceae bacterium]